MRTLPLNEKWKCQSFYREEQIGMRRVDFFVEEKVMVELKAIEKLEGVHKAQAINYCEAYNIVDGLLINFGNTSLDFKRVYNKKLVAKENLKYKSE
jgi:GxxExxY protein